MKKRTFTTGTELTDKQWAKFEPLIPEPIQSRKGGQHRASNRACLEGIIWNGGALAPYARTLPFGKYVLETFY